MEPGPLGLVAVGAVVLALSVLGAARNRIPAWEQRVFAAVNGWPDALFWFLWPPMQLGNLAVGTVAGLVVAGVAGERDLAVGVLVASGAKLLVERALRRRMARWLGVRQRPGTSQPAARLRGADVPRSGPSFPSGHVILVAGITAVLAHDLGWWTGVPLLLTALVMSGRVYVGAHNPLDVTAGLGAGLVVGGTVAALLVGVGWG